MFCFFQGGRFGGSILTKFFNGNSAHFANFCRVLQATLGEFSFSFGILGGRLRLDDALEGGVRDLWLGSVLKNWTFSQSLI